MAQTCETYRDEMVNGITVKSRIDKEGLGHFSAHVTWTDGGYVQGSSAYGFRSVSDAENEVAAMFRRAMTNGRIGGKPVEFNGFPVMA